MLIDIHCAKCIGIQAVPVTVEVDVSSGIGIHLVGLADIAVKESLLRTMTALQSIGFRIPGKKIVINLAPADVRKNGSGYDLPIALGIIAASGQSELPLLSKYMIMGELGLDASVRPIQGALPIAEFAAEQGLEGCIFPVESALEAADINGIKVFGVKNLEEVINILENNIGAEGLLVTERETTARQMHGSENNKDYMDFADIVGQESAKRGLEIAASGGHNAIMIGPPGSGKTSLAKALIGILPPMQLDESIITSKIYSVAGLRKANYGLMKERPFRAPHYSASLAAMIGGGNGDCIMPGEVSLAQNGVLFLDEFAQMPRSVTEALRSPLEDRTVVISRLRSKVEFPASFMLVAASNPCPCGYYGVRGRCSCSPTQRQSYIGKLSGPIMDRIDIQLSLQPVPPENLVHRARGESSDVVAMRVAMARRIQEVRFRNSCVNTNAEMSSEMIRIFCRLSEECADLMEKIAASTGLSARAFSRVLKLARTIADLEVADDLVNRGLSLESVLKENDGSIVVQYPDGSLSCIPEIQPKHILEAVNYRFLDK